MACQHPHTGYMTWPLRPVGGQAHAAENACDRPACRARAALFVAEATNQEPIWVDFPPAVVEKIARRAAR